MGEQLRLLERLIGYIFKWNTKAHYNSHFFIIRRPIWSVEDNFYTVRRIIYLNLLEMAGWWPSHARQADSAGGRGEGLPLWFVAAMKVSVSQSSELRACISVLSEDGEVCSLTLTALLCNPGPVRKPRKICKIFVANPAFPFIPRFKVRGFQQSWLLCSTKCKSHPSMYTGIPDWT